MNNFTTIANKYLILTRLRKCLFLSSTTILGFYFLLNLPILWVEKQEGENFVEEKKNDPHFLVASIATGPEVSRNRLHPLADTHTHITTQTPSPSLLSLTSDANISGAAGENMEGASEARRRCVFTEVFSSLFCRFILFTLQGSGRRVNFSSL